MRKKKRDAHARRPAPFKINPLINKALIPVAVLSIQSHNSIGQSVL